MAGKSRFAVGDKVMVTSVNAREGGPVERAVVRVGRLNVYTNSGYFGWREKGFRIEDGGEVGDYSHERVWTLQEWAERDEREDLTKRFRAAVGDTYGYRFERLSADKLRRILAILEEPA